MLRSLLTLAVLGPALAAAQAPSYFPLGLGDTRTYARLYPTSPTTWDVDVGGPYVVSETVTLGDVAYTAVGYPNAIVGSLHRVDEEGRVWVRSGDADVLVFDVTVGDGGTYEVPWEGAGFTYTVTVRRGLTVETFVGPIEGAIEFSFDAPDVADEEVGVTLAPGLGVVATWGAWTGDHRLFSARVGGRVYTDAEAGPEAGRLGGAWPNPFTTSATIRLPDGPAGPASVEVLDPLGRRVAVLHDGPVGPGEQTVTWAASGAPRGVYLVRVHRGGRTQTLRLVKR